MTSPALDLKLDSGATTPLYSQIFRQIRARILSGDLPPGTRLPASRRLATALQLARVTVSQAYDQLADEGFVQRRRGAGTFVADDLAALSAAAGEPGREGPTLPGLSPWGQRVQRSRLSRLARPRPAPEVDFSLGQPSPQIFPYGVWRRLLARYLSTDDTILARYGSAAGFDPLREAVADYLRRQRGVQCAVEQVVIVSGVQQALDILARLLIVPGSEIVVETPGYVDAFSLLELHGAQLRALPVDEAGLPTERLPARSQARLVFVTPANQFPRGGTMPLERRLALIRWATRHNTFIVEDDYDGELRYEGRPIGALQGLDDAGRVIYLGSFSKVIFPALRLGYVVLPEALLDPFVATKALTDRGAPTLTQAAVRDFIVEGHFERHLRRLRRVYGERRSTLVSALARDFPAGTVAYVPEPAGLHIMLQFRPDLNEGELVRQAAAAGVGVRGGAGYYWPGSNAWGRVTPYGPRPTGRGLARQDATVWSAPPASLLLGFSNLDEGRIRLGVARLAAIVRSLLV